MAVLVGSARIDENGNVSGGAAGDQTGKEVSLQEWYLHSKGWTIIRAKDDDARKKIADAMDHACGNPHIGYDQKQRSTAFNFCKKIGNYDPAAINSNVEVDCSSLVRLCCWYAGIQVGNFTTSNEVVVLNSTGKFEIINDERTNFSDELKCGDILVTKTKGHTVVVMNDGAKTKGDGDLKVLGYASPKGSMNVRAAASTKGKLLGSVRKGARVEVVQIYESGWYKIVWPKGEGGYAFTSNAGNKYFEFTPLKMEENPVPEEPAKEIKKEDPKVKYIVTATGGLFVRKGPGTQYGTCGVLGRNQVIEGIDEVDGWVKLADGSGFSSLKFLTRI